MADKTLTKAISANGAARGFATEAGSWVGMAFQPAVEYVLTIGTNNPAEKVVKRMDVKAAISHTVGAATSKAEDVFETAWEEGVRAGRALAREEAKRLKLKISSQAVSTEMKEQLQKSLNAILSDAQPELLRGYQEGGEDGLKAAQKRLAWRASLAVESAYKHARDEAMRAALGSTGSLKQWVTTSAFPCSNCLALAALPPIPWGEEFPDTLDGVPILKVYSNKFLGPPRHPNCGCILVAVKGG